MKKAIVNLVSDQTIPNVMFLKWYFRNNFTQSDLLFISTKKMEEKSKSKNIMESISYLEKFIGEKKILITNENDFFETKQILKSHFENYRYDEVVVNITGGTKLMSLACFEFFNEQKKTTIFYQTFGKDLQTLYPDFRKFEVTDLLTLNEFLKANGIAYKYDNTCLRSFEENKQTGILNSTNEEIRKYLVELQNTSYFENKFKRLEGKPLNFLEVEEEKFSNVKTKAFITKIDVCKYFADLGFRPDSITHSELRYMTGGWFEEYVYQKIKQERNLSEENIALNVCIKKDNSNNELDVVYLDKNNRLNVVECKSFIDEKTPLLQETIYKSQALKSKFGLNVKSYIYTASKINKETHLNRASDFDIEIVDSLLEE